jgi:hypothetical protein
MALEHVEQVRVHERLAADDAEEALPIAFASAIRRSNAAGWMSSCLAATSTSSPGSGGCNC